MRTMTVGDLKAHFSEVIQRVKSGEEIAIAFGKKKEIVAYLVPKAAVKPSTRPLGILQKKGKATFAADFELTDDEFLGL